MALRKKKAAEAVAIEALEVEATDMAVDESTDMVETIVDEFVDHPMLAAVKELEIAWNGAQDINIQHGQPLLAKAINNVIEHGKDLPKVLKV